MRKILLIIPVILGIVIGAGFFYLRSRPTKVLSATSPLPSPPPSELEQITSLVGQLIELPTGEMPTLGTVTDLDKVKGQNFFAFARLGDRVLVYPQAKRAILFRPDTGKVIEIASVIINTVGSSSPSATP